MKTKKEIRNVIDKHCQKYSHSCSPSLVEMLLKLEDAVSPDYYEEQARDQNEPVGLKNIENKTIAGKTFRKIESCNDKSVLIPKIIEELKADRFLGIYVKVSDTDVHGYVIAWLEGDNVQLLGKHSETGGGEGCRTDAPTISLDRCHTIATDCIYYEG